MNYLAHFVFNHRISGLEIEPYFALGVALPDLWLRFSRSRRLCWRAVRESRPSDRSGVQLRAGLLNHVEVDRLFHTTPAFLGWQRDLKGSLGGCDVHPALLDFVCHAGIELVIDHLLLCEEPELVEQFYDVLSGCEADEAACLVGEIGAVDTAGLGHVVRRFTARRFLRRYRSLSALPEVVGMILALADIGAPPPAVLERLFVAAAEMVDLRTVWGEMTAD